MNKVQVIVYQAEDLIDKLLIQAKLHQEKNNVLTDYANIIKDRTITIKSILEKMKKISDENQHSFPGKANA